MKRSPSSRPCLAALRPWPFGPPRRGRAPRGAAGAPAARGQASPVWSATASGPRKSGQATAPIGGLAWSHPIYSA